MWNAGALVGELSALVKLLELLEVACQRWGGLQCHLSCRMDAGVPTQGTGRAGGRPEAEGQRVCGTTWAWMSWSYATLLT